MNEQAEALSQDSSEFDALVSDVLSKVYDPCSVAARAPVSILDMGLVVGWSLEPYGCLFVRMRTTTPGCTMVPYFVRAARDELAKLPGVRQVEIDLSDDTFWTPELISERGRRVLDAAREAAQRVRPVVPQAWRLALKPNDESKTRNRRNADVNRVKE